MILPQRIADAMSTDLHTTTPETGIMNAVSRLVEHNVSGLLVLDARQQLVGILTERDCIEAATQAGYFDETAGTVGDYMSTRLVTVEAGESLMDLAERFARERYRRYPVLDDGRLVGIIARRDILRTLTRGSWFTRPGR